MYSEFAISCSGNCRNIFRCELDGSNVEMLGWNFRNNWEACVDSFGTIWQSDTAFLSTRCGT